MGLMSFVKGVGRKMGILGDREDEQAAAAAEAAKQAAAAAAEAAKADQAAQADHQQMWREAVRLDIFAAIQSYVEVRDLDVAFDGTTAIVTGQTSSQADREKAVLVAGNTEDVAHVDDRITVSVPEPEATFHTVQSGDTLSQIAGATYGNVMLYDLIFDANRPMLAHPDAIYPGQVLRIPPREQATYTVKPGDTLGKIAKRLLGDAKRYTEIFEANKSSLTSADAIDVGQVLRIP